MARGTIAKNNVVKKIAEAFGQDFVGEVDKKLYVYADDGGERVQIAIALTCPKVSVDPAGAVVEPTPASNFPSVNVTPAATASAEISEQEKENIAALMARLGL